jgi:hypothetical protein
MGPGTPLRAFTALTMRKVDGWMRGERHCLGAASPYPASRLEHVSRFFTRACRSNVCPYASRAAKVKCTASASKRAAQRRESIVQRLSPALSLPRTRISVTCSRVAWLAHDNLSSLSTTFDGPSLQQSKVARLLFPHYSSGLTQRQPLMCKYLYPVDSIEGKE